MQALLVLIAPLLEILLFQLSLPKELVRIIEAHGDEESFRINRSKTRFAGKDGCQIITGVVMNEKPNLKRSYYRELRSCLHTWKTQGKRAAAAKYFHIDNPPDCDVEKLEECLFGRLTYYEYVTRGNPGRRTPLEKLGSAFNRLAERHQFQIHRPEDSIFLLSVDENPVDEVQGYNEAIAFMLQGYGLVACQHVFKNTEAEYGAKVTFALQCYSGEKTTVASDLAERSKCSSYDCVRFDVDNEKLKRDCESLASLQIAAEPAAVGDTVYAFRCAPVGGGHNEWTLNEYHVNRILDDNGQGTQYFVKETLFRGMSGGPVMNSNGEIVGLVYSGHDFDYPDRPLSRNSFIGFDHLDGLSPNSVF